MPAAKQPRKWSAAVTAKSDALDLKAHLFQSDSALEIAKSLKRSAERSKRRKGTPFQSAMSMLTFYMNRAGKNLHAAERRKLTSAKAELRRLFGKAE